MSPLEVKELEKVYENGFKALDKIGFSLKEGEIFGLLGPNGSGKTTLISIISTLIEATSGSVSVFGHRVGYDQLESKRLLGVVPQEIVSHGFFTVNEILQFVSGYYSIKNNQEHIDFLLENLGLEEHKNKRVAQLSGGMKRRLLIAKALVHKPKLLLLDEPTAGVDIELRNSLWKFVRDLNQKGCTVLLTTHYLEEAESLCDRVGIINHGKLIRIGETSEMIKEFTNREFVIDFIDKAPIVDSKYLIEKKEASLIFRVPSGMEFGQLMAEIKVDISSIKDFQIREGSLEDAFIRVLGEQNAK